MVKKWIIGLALLGLMACNKETSKLSKLPDDGVILAFGDSLTYGTGATAEHDYPALLSALSGREVINEGVPGEISSEGRQRLPQLLDEYQPHLLILIHGGNDILRQINVEETRANLKAMIAEAKQRNIPTVMLGIPKFGLVFLHSAEVYAELAQSEQVPTDLETLPAILSSNDLKSDTVHPNDRGYQKLAENIAALLREQGAL
ncbi:GDSL-type esterase/lipase family protein [Methylomonas sp. SURF-2]|uniref:GDSL-type esterase/lipase family protein n=1 Tax=Methylomonas subterranea TaxID=2952225 RepID=A0ABT1TDA5_9GAMM|nr:GDSL-type esterase/lipase family protein [Methylomonas sp. SURF-2]MCQ8103410.1 GDSL-type esterase/lipase family protein [Methylomonas sp. SURF-2]